MLKRLYIKDFAIVENLEIEFNSGFQVITGETGAGKSVIVGAIGLLCGERGQSDLVRSGAQKAILEAEFQLPPEKAELAVLNKLDIDTFGDNIIIIRREVNPKGVSRAFINDTPVNVTTLNMLTTELIDLHGQHQHQRLIHPENHIYYLDAFAKNTGLVQKHRESFRKYIRIKGELLELKKKIKTGYDKQDLLTLQVKELEKANLQENELEELKSERKILENNELLFDMSNLIGAMLYSSDDPVSNKVAVVCNKLKSLVDIDPVFRELLENLENARVTIEETGRYCEAYASNLEFTPERLEEIRNREVELEWLLKKYQKSQISDMIQHLKELKDELETMENFDDTMAELEKELENQRQTVQSSAIELSEKRHQSGKIFEKELETTMTTVGLQNARFEVHLFWQEEEEGIVSLNGKKYQVTENGLDNVEFAIGLNIGEPTRPLHKVASGGEVSRIMLSIKTLLADSDKIDTLVFDEIDSGISGKYAQIVGKKMHEISKHHQLIVITHLPQIAAQGDFHYAVIKDEAEGRTRVTVRKLNDEDRIFDIAKLLGGEKVTEQAMANATELLNMNK